MQSFRSRLLLRTGVLLLALFFLSQLLVNAGEALRMDHSRSDLYMFYAGSQLLLSDQRERLYDADTQVRAISGVRFGNVPDDVSRDASPYIWYRFYNPPLFLLAMSPLTLLAPHAAYLAAVGANVVLLGLLAVVFGFVLRWRQPQTLLIWLALPAVDPTYTTIQHAQPTFLIAALIGLACLAIRNERHVLAGALLALTGVKPNWLVPGASLFHHRRVYTALIGASLAFLALPYLVLGPGGIGNYVSLVLDRGGTDLENRELGLVIVGWSGFFHALTGEAQPWLWLVASVVTLLLFFVIVQRKDANLTLAAAIPTALLVIPHENPQDLVLLFASAAILLSLHWSRAALTGICACLLAAFVGANQWNGARAAALAGHHTVYWISLACFATLAWLAGVALFELRGAGGPSLATRPQALGLARPFSLRWPALPPRRTGGPARSSDRRPGGPRATPRLDS